MAPTITDTASLVSEARALLATRQFAEACAVYQRICALKPTDAEAWHMLSGLQGVLQRYSESENSARVAIGLNPGFLQAYNNLGTALLYQERADEARVAYEQMLVIDPKNVPAHLCLGDIHYKKNDYTKAESHYREAAVGAPGDPEIPVQLAAMYMKLGRDADAIAQLRIVQRLDPDHQGALYLLACMGEAEAPARMEAKRVAALFDSFADNFDQHLVTQLEYRTPELLARALRDNLPDQNQNLDILDLGCGTGLLGPLLKPWARRLVGVDLSSRMIAKARARLVYDELIVADILDAVRESERYDLIAAADVFVYIGDLQAVFHACVHALRPGGLFAFSVEVHNNEESYLLRSTGRYAHTTDYIQRLGAGYDLRPIHNESCVLRKEKNQPVSGMLCVFVRH